MDGNEEKITSKIIGCRITKDVLDEVSKVIDEEYQEAKSTDKYSTIRYSFKVRQRDREYATDNRTNFISNNIIRPDLSLVNMQLYSRNIDVIARLHLSIMDDSYIEIKSNNLTKLNGINGRIESIFSEPTIKTRNYLFHSRWSWVISYMIAISLNVFNPLFFQYSIFDRFVWILFWSISLSIILKFFFTWLFPKVETQYSIQVKIRKAVLASIIAIGFTLLGNYIWMHLTDLWM